MAMGPLNGPPGRTSEDPKISTRFALLMAAAAVLPLLAYGAVSIFSAAHRRAGSGIQGNLNVAGAPPSRSISTLPASVKILRPFRRPAADGPQPWQQDRILKTSVLEFPEYAS